MGSRRWGVLVAGAVLAVVVVALGSAGIANGAEAGAVAKCNTAGRLFCVTVNTFAGITASDSALTNGKRYTWAEWSLTNTGGNTLTNPKAIVTLADYDCSAYKPPISDPTRAPDPATDCASRVRTSAFLIPTDPNVCSLAALTQTLTCSYANLPSTNPDTSSPTTRVYFKTADAPATHTVITVQGLVKERASDSNTCVQGDPNCDTITNSIINSYEPNANEGVTFALNGKSFHLATNDERSSFDFTSLKSDPFRTNLTTTYPDACGANPLSTCFFRTLNVTTDPNTTGYNNGPVVFYARLTGLASGVTANNVVAIHTYSSAHTPNPDTIGDQNSERSNNSCTFDSTKVTVVPSICAKKPQGLQAVDVWIWDSSNGGIKFGGS